MLRHQLFFITNPLLDITILKTVSENCESSDYEHTEKIFGKIMIIFRFISEILSVEIKTFFIVVPIINKPFVFQATWFKENNHFTYICK